MKLKKNLLWFPLLFTFAFALVLTACQQEEQIAPANETEEVLDDVMTLGGVDSTDASAFERGRRGRCFELVFPISVEYPDGTTEEVADQEALRALLKAWKESAGKDAERLSFVFPFDVVLRNGSVVTVTGDTTLRRLRNFCKDGPRRPGRGDRKERCYALVFPLTLNFPDGTTKEITDKETLGATLSEWKANNPDAESRPEIAFPYEITLEDGSVVTVSDAEELKSLVGDCREENREPCYELVFPITVNFPDGSALEVADREALRTALKDWKTNNPDAESRPAFAFPYSVILSDGTEQSITSEEEAKALRESCRPDKKPSKRPGKKPGKGKGSKSGVSTQG